MSLSVIGFKIKCKIENIATHPHANIFIPSTFYANSPNMKLYKVYSRYDIEPVKGKDWWVWNQAGEQYLDFYGGHAVISIGHAHPHFVTKIQEQVATLPFYSNAVPNALQDELAEKLGALSGCQEYQLFLCNSGAEANENALKLASFQNGRKKVISFKNGFHGRTSAAVNATHNPKIQAPINQGFEVEFHDWKEEEKVWESLAKQDVCTVIIESVQGIGGIHIPSKEFLEKLAQHCKQNGTLLILDEVQAGYGRTGYFFGFQHAAIEPDIITVAKGMGNGFPLGGVLIHPSIQSEKGQLGSTFGGNHLACAAGIAVLDVIKNENLIERAAQNGQWLINQLTQLPNIKEVRGMGLMIGIELHGPAKQLRNQLLYEEKVFTGSSSNPNTIRLLPPLSIDQEALDLFLTKFKKVIQQANQTQTV